MIALPRERGEMDDVVARLLRQSGLAEGELGADGRAALERVVAAARVEIDAHERAWSELSRIIEALPSMVLVRRGPLVVYGNAALWRRLGYASMDEVAGRPVMDLVFEEDRESVAQRMAAIDAGDAAPAGDFRLLAKSGGVIHVHRDAVERVEYHGAPAAMVVMTDMTEMRAMQARVQVADRMASLGTMAAGVAHEINNPLAYVVANLEFAIDAVHRVREGVPLETEAALEALEDAAGGARRVHKIVGALKTFTRVDDDVRTALAVNDLLDQAVELAWGQIRHRARLVRAFGTVPVVHANEGRLVQVFVNLLVNAAQAIPEGGAGTHTITVRTSATAHGEVVVEVSDTGGGISPSALPRIFEPFFTTKPRGVGTGLGLSICHGIVQALGGSMDVESAVGRGSTFRVTLPRGAAKGASSSHSLLAPRATRARILVVDDEPAIGTAVRRLLLEHDVASANDARSALRALREGEPFDVVLCDVMMPGASGMDLFEAACARDRALAERFVFVTGCAFTPPVMAFFERTGRPRLLKPFTAAELRTAIADALARGATG